MAAPRIEYNPNPRGRNVGDCAIRAVAKATGQSWETTYAALCVEGFCVGDLPNSNSVFGRYLERNGFEKRSIPDSCISEYAIDDFCRDHPEGTYVLCLSGHVVCVEDGTLWDSWDSGREIVLYYFEKR